MALLNGRLPRKALAPITRADNGDRAYLLRNAAKAFNAMNAEAEARFGVTLRAASGRTAYRNRKQQQYFWQVYQNGGNVAAKPGTSNHGWGLAIDLATPEMRRVVDKIGAKYGWAKRWSDAPSEWWHLKYRTGIWNGKTPYSNPVLRRGAKGRKVLRLKKLMRGKGLRGFNRYTPIFDAKTEAAIKRLQRKHDLRANGVVGPKTWEVLGRG